MKITVTLPKGAGALLERFAKTMIVGETIEEAANYLLIRALDDLTRSGFRTLTDMLAKDNPPAARMVPLKTAEPVPSLAVLVPVVQETEEDRIARANWQTANAITSTSEPAPAVTIAAALEKPTLIKSPEPNAPPAKSVLLAPVSARELAATLDQPSIKTRAFPDLTGRPRAPVFKGAVLAADKMPALTDGQRRVFDVYREADGYALSLSEVVTLARVPHGSVSHHRDCLVKKGYAIEHRFPGGQQALRIIVGAGDPKHADVPAAKPRASEETQKAAAQALGSEIARDEPAADDHVVLIDDLSVRMQVLLRSFLTFGAAPPRNESQLATHCGLERQKLAFLLNRLRELKLIQGSVAAKWILTENGRKLALQVPVVIPAPAAAPIAKTAETKVTYPVVRRVVPTFGNTITDQQREAIDKHLSTKGARTFEPGATAEPWVLEEQLRKKGHTVSRVASSGWIVDGRKRTQEDVVAMINKYRAAVDLPPLTAPTTK